MTIWDLMCAAIIYGIIITVKWRRAERRLGHHFARRPSR